MARRRRRRGGGPSLWRVVVILTPFIIVAVLVTQFVLSNKGQYWMAQNIWRGDSERVIKVVGKVLAESSVELGLPTPHPTLSTAPATADSSGVFDFSENAVGLIVEDGTNRGYLKTIARATVNLSPSTSTISANAQISGDLQELGLKLVHGIEQKNHSVHLLFDAGKKTHVSLRLVPAKHDGLDSLVVVADDEDPVPIKVRMALILNRYGRDRDVSARCEKLPGEYTVAIYSELDEARVWSDRARAKGMEVLLNLPMEPKGFPNPDPGPNAILVDMSGRRIRSLYKQALKKIGPVEGIKTFYGSLAVEDPDVMRVVLEETKRADLFFFDTTRSRYSLSEELGRRMEVPVIPLHQKGSFHWNNESPGAVENGLKEFVKHCEKRGYGIAVITPSPETISVYEKRLPELARQGIVAVKLTEVIEASRSVVD